MLHRFPNFEHSSPSTFSINPHNHINLKPDDVYMGIPKGKKYYAWFTFHKTYNICLFIDANTKQTYYEKVPYSSLSLGTVLYGTLVKYKTQSEFVAENIFYNEGKYLENMEIVEKIKLFTLIFEKNCGMLPVKTRILMAPIWRGEFPADRINKTKLYKIYNLTPGHDAGAGGTSLRLTSAPPVPAPAPAKKMAAPAPPPAPPQKKQVPPRQQSPQVFFVKADIINDIYHLFTAAPNLKYHSIAFIPTYKSSVFMNSIFRKIKENSNLDLLEESDDEEEFENINYDKYVDLDKTVKMQCVYNNKFKKWTPVQIV
jgi:hypothetical protein